MIRRPAMLNERREGRASFVALCIVFALVILILVLDALRAQFCIIVEVKGDSMRDTLYGGVESGADYEGGDIVYAVRTHSVSRGDIVILDTTASDAYDPAGGSVFTAATIVKRIVAVEGDCIRCTGGVVYRKEAGGEYRALQEGYVKGVTPDFGEVRLGEGEIFFLGDNRASSADSEDLVRAGYALFTEEDVIGVVPGWALACKGFTTVWENFRAAVHGFFTGTSRS